jgi:hypothetical protein
MSHDASKRPKFFLSKWYFDCVSDDGEAFIGYTAEMRWRTFSIDYSSTLHYRPNGKIRSATSLRKIAPPRVEDSYVQWNSRHLGVIGKWIPITEPIERTLVETEAGSIEWNCLQPNAKAEIAVDNNRIEGSGYVDHVTITIPPWQLPFDQLRWGRFHANSDAIVWLDCQGGNEINLAFHNSAPIENWVIDAHSLRTRDVSLELETGDVLREGPLLRTALAKVPGIDKVFPDSILHTYECKRLSRGMLRTSPMTAQPGWAIHEAVCFGKK